MIQSYLTFFSLIQSWVTLLKSNVRQVIKFNRKINIFATVQSARTRLVYRAEGRSGTYLGVGLQAAAGDMEEESISACVAETELGMQTVDDSLADGGSVAEHVASLMSPLVLRPPHGC